MRWHKFWYSIEEVIDRIEYHLCCLRDVRKARVDDCATRMKPRSGGASTDEDLCELIQPLADRSIKPTAKHLHRSRSRPHAKREDVV